MDGREGSKAYPAPKKRENNLLVRYTIRHDWIFLDDRGRRRILTVVLSWCPEYSF